MRIRMWLIKILECIVPRPKGLYGVKPRADGAWYQEDIWRAQVEERRILSSKVPHYGYSTCSSCHLPWWLVFGHTIYFQDGHSQKCFAVCEMCWNNLPREEIWPYYDEWSIQMYPESPEIREKFRTAIMGRNDRYAKTVGEVFPFFMIENDN